MNMLKNFDLIELDGDTVESEGTCPRCKEPICIFIKTNLVSCVCKHCGYVAMTIPKQINLDTFRKDEENFT